MKFLTNLKLFLFKKLREMRVVFISRKKSGNFSLTTLSQIVEEMDDCNPNRKIRRRNVEYKFFWSFCNKEDFDTWLKQLRSAKKWQKKYIRKDRNRKEFIWFNHNTLRFKKTCEYSRSENGFCEARMKVPTRADRENRYILELNEDGCEHFLSEFYPTFRKLITKENDGWEQLEVPRNADLSNFYPSSSAQPTPITISDTDVWEDLANRFMEAAKIYPSRTLTQSQLQPMPPSIAYISEYNGRIDWGLLEANTQLQMVFAKCTAGITRDAEFLTNFRALISMRLPQLGVSHYFLGGLDSPTAEEQFGTVNQVLDEVGFNKRKDLFAIIIQTERNSDFAPLSFTAKLIRFISLLRKADFMRPIIYCNNNSWNTLIDHSDANAEEQFSKLPLWIAHFVKEEALNYPETWKSRGIPWWMWNYTHTGSLSGIINQVKFNRRNEFYFINDENFHSNV